MSTPGILYFTDDAKIIADMLKNEWHLGPEEQPNIEYKPESYFMNARKGTIFVSVVNTGNEIATTDYRTYNKNVRLIIKLDTRFRETHFLWGQEIYRILLANRRIGRRHNMGNSYLLINDHHTLPNESGWYTTVFDVTFIAYHVTIDSAGFGDKINSQIKDNEE